MKKPMMLGCVVAGERSDGLMDGWKDGWMNGRMDG